MVTLTYPESYSFDGRIIKEQLRRFMQELKRQADSHRGRTDNVAVDDYSAFWFLEYQKRGAPHFHIFTTHRYDKNWIADTWFRIVGSEDLRHKKAGTRIEKLKSGRRGACSYALKYAAKLEQKDPPEWIKNCGRFWGVSGNRECVAADTLLGRNALDNKGIKARLTTIAIMLDNEVILGNAVKFGDHSKCFYLKNDTLVSKMRAELSLLQIQASGYLDSYHIWDFSRDELGGYLDNRMHSSAEPV
jgi:hypothetical protein